MWRALAQPLFHQLPLAPSAAAPAADAALTFAEQRAFNTKLLNALVSASIPLRSCVVNVSIRPSSSLGAGASLAQAT